MSQSEQEWWKKNPGFTVQNTFSSVEAHVLEIVQGVTGKKFGVRDIRGTRQVKRIGEHIYRGNVQLISLRNTRFSRIDFCLAEEGNFQSVTVIVAYEEQVKVSEVYHPIGFTIYTKVFHKVDDGDDYYFEEVPFDESSNLDEWWGGRVPSPYTNLRSLRHVYMDEDFAQSVHDISSIS